jgi:streptogramin lyase
LALQGQRVAFGEQRGEVGLLDPNASTVTEWPIPQVNSVVPSAYHVAVQGKYIFYSDWNQGVIGMVNTSSNELTQWQLPGAPIGRAPNGLVVTGSSSAIQVWAADQGANKIILLTPANNTYTEWLIPGLDSDFTLQHVDVASDGTILFQDNDFNFVARLNPFTNIVQTWTIPTVFSSPNAVASLSVGTMVFDEGAGNKIGTLDLSTAPTSQAAVLPTQTVVLPNVQVVAPTVTAVAQSATTVSPTLTGASRNVVGGFNEYPIPTAFSGPDGVAISNGRVLFTESSFAANKIGLLR